MLRDKITSAHAALGVLAGNVTEEQWGVISCIRGELKDAADQVFELESRMMDELVTDFVQMAADDDQKRLPKIGSLDDAIGVIGDFVLQPEMDEAVNRLIEEAKTREQQKQMEDAGGDRPTSNASDNGKVRFLSS